MQHMVNGLITAVLALLSWPSRLALRERRGVNCRNVLCNLPCSNPESIAVRVTKNPTAHPCFTT